MTETAETDPLSGFAALMGQAAEDVQGNGADPEAPYGYTTDPRTGQERPKRAPGRPRKSPSLDDLKAAKEDADPVTVRDDRAPEAPKGGRRGRRARAHTPGPGPAIPQKFRSEGAIAKAVNAQYRKLGKIVRAFDADIGEAVIATTVAIDADDVTVGDAWEHLCQSNPRVRAFVLRMLSRGAVGELLWAHMPIVGAILMKDAIRRRIPFGRLVEALADQDDGEGGQAPGEAPSAGTLLDGLTPDDMAQMAGLAQAFMAQQMARGTAAGPVRGDGGDPGV